MQSPHNRFVLGHFGTPERAPGLLEAQLPAALKALVRLEEVTVEKSHFVDENMSELESDLLFRIPRVDREGDVFVYVLWEHQRNRDSWMVLRMWIYLAMLYRHLVLKEGVGREGGKLPFVYPIVLYQGTKGWEKGLVLEDLIDVEGLPRELHEWIPRFAIDLIRLDEDSPRVKPLDPMARLGLGLMRAVMLDEVEGWLKRHVSELNELFVGQRHAVKLMLKYVLVVGEGLTGDKFREIIVNGENMKLEYLPNTPMDHHMRDAIAEWEKKEAGLLTY